MTRRRNTLSKTLKDYIVPIIGVVLIAVLIFNVFSGGNNDVQNTLDKENQVGYGVSLDSAQTEGYVVYPGDYRKQIEGDITLYKGEKVVVKEGSLSLDFLSMGAGRINKLGELKYSEEGDLELYSSDFWVNSTTKGDLTMRYANISFSADSALSFSQNEMGSTIYLLSGFAEVSNKVGETTVLAPGKKVTISRLDSNNEDVDLVLLKDDIDDYFKQSDWFVKNNGASYLGASQESSTGSTSKLISSSSSTSYLGFNNLQDESQVSSDTIKISGTYTDETIIKITLNGTEAQINSSNKSFTFSSVSTSKKENDLVFKVVDDSGDTIEKILYTVYYDGGSSASTSGSKGFAVKNFSVDGSKFTFTSPTTSNSYSTREAFVTIRGNVLNKGISSVTVNGYKLSSFNGSTWRYHASEQNDNLKDGTNIYEIKYFDASGNLAYTNYYTIIKNADQVEKTEEIETKEEKTFSDEA
ncbi:hypothetical protein A9Q91_00760 [Candidatus Gracilibacteria bacterium 28_42_T64]|nr:hypothetical protein A9Q91_00760 [Candidatus Gracilibacteria bacterium 28_42_T64]